MTTRPIGQAYYYGSKLIKDMKVGKVIALSKSPTHTMSKTNSSTIQLLQGLGVAGDAHMGTTVKHRSRVAKAPSQPNLRQVHLIHKELLDELQIKGFEIAPGVMGENITTSDIALLDLPQHTILRIGPSAQIQITGLRNPCYQLDGIQKGLMKAVLDKDEEGQLVRKAGIMGIVLASGEIKKGDKIEVQLPPLPHNKLQYV